jgi:hypothetical protein
VSPPRARLAGRIALGLCLFMAVPATVLLVLGPGRAVHGDLFGGPAGMAFLLLSLAFATLGALIASRVPDNRIGWLFCLIGLLIGAAMLSYQYANYSLQAASDPLPGARLAAWFPSEPIAPLLAFALLLFPDGRLPSPSWRPAAAVLAVGLVLLAVPKAIRAGALDDPFSLVTNPLGIAGTREAMTAADTAGWVLVAAGMALGAASMVVRLRRAQGIERQQLKLVLAVGTGVASVTALLMTTWFVWPDGNLQLRMAILGLAFTAFPVAAGAAILRYRLYEIDVAINRALVYAALSATLAAAYLGCVLLLQLALDPVTSGSSLAVAVSTLAVAALFGPARSRIQLVVDRRFYRRRYDAARTLELFSARLREQVDLDALGGELRAVVSDTMQPAHVSLWLRRADR